MARVTPPGQSAYSPNKFQPRKAQRAQPAQWEGNPYDQTLPGERLNRAAATDREERIRPDGNLPKFLRPEEHVITAVHPLYETVCMPNGDRAFYIVREGLYRCTCGQECRALLDCGQYVQPWDEAIESQPGEILIDWPDDMLPPEPEVVPEPEILEADPRWWEGESENG